MEKRWTFFLHVFASQTDKQGRILWPNSSVYSHPLEFIVMKSVHWRHAVVAPCLFTQLDLYLEVYVIESFAFLLSFSSSLTLHTYLVYLLVTNKNLFNHHQVNSTHDFNNNSYLFNSFLTQKNYSTFVNCLFQLLIFKISTYPKEGGKISQISTPMCRLKLFYDEKGKLRGLKRNLRRGGGEGI